MTKQQLDSYISHNYPKLINIAAGINRKNGRAYDPACLVSEGYIHVLKIIDTIEDEDQLQRYIITKISYESRYDTSPTTLRNTVKDKEQLLCILPDESVQYAEKEYILKGEAYFSQCDRIWQRMYQAYFIEGHKSVRKFAEYFNFSNGLAAKLINQMKEEIKSIEI